MLDALKKALGSKEAAKPVETLKIEIDTAEVKAAIEAAVAEVRVEFDEYKQTAEAMVAAAEEQAAALQSQLDAANALVAEYREAAEKAAAEAASAAAAALAAKLNARKEKLVASIGTERADALLVATEGMDDAAFEAVASALGVASTTEAASDMFKEVGADAVADAAAVTAPESAEMKILREKYGKK